LERSYIQKKSADKQTGRPLFRKITPLFMWYIASYAFNWCNLYFAPLQNASKLCIQLVQPVFCTFAECKIS